MCSSSGETAKSEASQLSQRTKLRCLEEPPSLSQIRSPGPSRQGGRTVIIILGVGLKKIEVDPPLATDQRLQLVPSEHGQDHRGDHRRQACRTHPCRAGFSLLCRCSRGMETVVTNPSSWRPAPGRSRASDTAAAPSGSPPAQPPAQPSSGPRAATPPQSRHCKNTHTAGHCQHPHARAVRRLTADLSLAVQKIPSTACSSSASPEAPPAARPLA
jgi:hypothetical protein